MLIELVLARAQPDPIFQTLARHSAGCTLEHRATALIHVVVDALSALRRLRRLGADLLDASAVRGEEDD